MRFLRCNSRLLLQTGLDFGESYLRASRWSLPFFTALHAMQTRSSDYSVCPSLCLSVRPSVCQTRAL